MRFRLSLLYIVQVLVECHEGLVLVILTRNVGAERAKLFQLQLDILGRGLDVRLDPTQVFIMVHLRSCISNDLDVLGQELVSVLEPRSVSQSYGRFVSDTAYESEQSWILRTGQQKIEVVEVP
jgi:hypothetical protein